jgi:hypothetical protein
MQLGSRFSVGQAPASLPVDMRDQIAAVESELGEQERATLRWTLTWLEGRPIVELDNGVTLGGSRH